jgi:O-antigen/teichoic acid export membrane protein
MLVSKLAERGLGLISTLILARLLLPADFGLVAMAAPVVALVELLGALGMDAALIQRRNLDRAHLDTAFTLNLIVAVAMAVSLWVLAPLAAAYFHEQRLEAVINWLALGNLVQGFGNPGLILFRKDIEMRPEVVVLIGKKLSSLVVAAAAALLIGNYWALVWGTLVSRLVGVGLSYALAPYRPRLTLSATGEVLGFSAWVWVTQLIGLLYLRANDLVIGRLLGATQLAYFNLSTDLATTATSEAVTAISRAAFPALAKISNESQRLRMGLRHILSGVAMFALPAALGIAATSELLIVVLLGPRWMPASEILTAVAISSAVFGITGQFSNAYLALGHPRATAIVAAIGLPTLIGCSVMLIPTHGLAAVNVAYPATAVTITVGHFVLLRRLMPAFRASDWIAAFWRPLIAAGAMYLLVRIAAQWVGPIHGSVDGLVPLTGMIILGALSYAIALLVLWRLSGSPGGPEALIWARLHHGSATVVSRAKKPRFPT